MKRSAIETTRQIRETMHFRLNQAGTIKTDDAWQIVRLSSAGRVIGYSTIVTKFREIMVEMVKNSLATKVRNGLWKVHNPDTFNI